MEINKKLEDLPQVRCSSGSVGGHIACKAILFF